MDSNTMARVRRLLRTAFLVGSLQLIALAQVAEVFAGRNRP